MSTKESSHRLERIILTVAIVTFIPTLLLAQYLQHYLSATPLLKALPILHIAAEYLKVFISLYIFLLTWHTYADRRDTFILFLGHVFLMVGLLGLSHVFYNQNRIGNSLPVEHDYFFAVSHFLLPLGLLAGVFAAGKGLSVTGRFYFLCGTILFFALILAAKLYLTPYLLPIKKNHASDLIDWRILTVLLYATAVFIYYKKKPLADPKTNALFLGALVLLLYSEACNSQLCLQYRGFPFKSCGLLAHPLEIASYLIIYWAVFVLSIRYPYKTLCRVKEHLAERYSELSAALEMLGQSEERYRLLVETSNDLIYTLSPSGRITFVNQNIDALTGHTPAELYGKSVFDLLTRESKRKIIAQTRRLLKTGHARAEDLEILTKDDRKKTIMVNVQPIYRSKGKITGFQGIARDVSELRREQEQMLHSEKLATVGLIASGIAHEIGTPLNIISGNAEFLLTDLPEHHPMHEELETIVDQCQRISDQVKSLLDFARPSVLQLVPLDINEIIYATLRFLRHMITPQHHVQLELAPELPPLTGDKYKLQQLLINLLLNAFQAMPRGGSLHVSTYIAPQLDNSATEPPYIHIKIQDSGHGIEREKLKSIFDPFFTTKETEQGTGLGLAVCLKIVKDHGGLIEVESEVNRGSTFTVHLPLSTHFTNVQQEEDQS